MECENGNKILNMARRKVGFLFLWMALGVVAAFSAMVSLQSIQTSINIVDNKGAISLTTAYAVSIFSGLFCCPMLLKYVGANGTLVISDICYLCFCLSNLSQDLSILLVGAVTSGTGRATMLPAYTITVLDIAASSAKLSNTKNDRFYEDYFQSKFYTMLESVSIFGNLLSYSVLFGFEATSKNTHEIVSTTQSPGDRPNSTNVFEDPYQYCGVNDCQDSEVINQSLDQYQPPDRTSVYILVAVAGLLSVGAICVHIFVYPGLGSFSHKLKKIELWAHRALLERNIDDGNMGEKTSTKIGKVDNIIRNEAFVNFDDVTDKCLESETDSPAIIEDSNEQEQQFANSEEGKSDANETYWNTLKYTGQFLLKPRAMMLNISTLHHGMMLGFIFADVTRAYASCIVGVELTGLFAVMFGVMAMPAALLYGEIQFSHKRYILFAASCILELGLYCLCFFWIPNSSDLWVLLVLFGGFGIVNSIFRQNIIAAYILHFPEDRSVALSVFGVFFSAGIGVQYGLSIWMCVKEIIFIQIGVLLAGCASFVLAEYIRHMKLSTRSDEQETELNTKL